jgi:hypothetical protein
MNARVHTSVIAAALAAGSAGSLVAEARALAAPRSNGCPSGFQLLSVETLTDEGYHLPALVDSPTSGVPSYGRYSGDGDG